MKRKLLLLSSVLMNLSALFILFPLPVQAYIDPSAVSYVAQAVIGIVVALIACLTIFRHKIVSFIKKNKNEEKKEVHFKDLDSNDTESKEDQ